MKLRQSLIGSADVCLRRAAYTLDPTVQGGQSEARVKGTAYHGGVEHYYTRRKMHGGYLAPTSLLVEEVYEAAAVAFEAAESEWGGFDGPWETTRDEALISVQSMLHRYFADGQEWPRGYVVLGVEERFDDVPLGEHSITGTADLLLVRESDDKIVITDHKTAKRRWDKKKHTVRMTPQPPFYIYAFGHCWSRPWSDFEFWFDIMNPNGNFERREATPTPEEIEFTLQKAQNMAVLLESVPLDILPGNTQSNLCSEKWCDYWSICPFGAALDRP